MEGLGIDWKLLIAQLINFGLFFYVFKKFLAKPFVNFIEEEKVKELEKEKALQKAKKLEEEFIQKEEEIREKAKKEAQVIVNEAKQAAEKVKEGLLSQAREEAEEIKQRTKKQLDIERDLLYGEVKDKIAKLSFLIVRDALKDMLPEEVKRKITEQILKNSAKQAKVS